MSNSIASERPLKKASRPQFKKPQAAVAFYGLEATVCYLMTRFMTHPCFHTARAIVHHLRLLTEQPEVQDEAECNNVYEKLLEEWQVITSVLSQRPNPSPPVEPTYPAYSEKVFWDKGMRYSWKPEKPAGSPRGD